jgi:hypothetical protein
VEPDPSARHEHLLAPKSGRRRYAAQFPAALFGGEEPPRPVFDPATGRWRASRTARPEVILAGVAAGTVIALVGTFLWAEVWATLGVVFVAAVLMLATAALLAAKSQG